MANQSKSEGQEMGDRSKTGSLQSLRWSRNSADQYGPGFHAQSILAQHGFQSTVEHMNSVTPEIATGLDLQDNEGDTCEGLEKDCGPSYSPPSQTSHGSPTVSAYPEAPHTNVPCVQLQIDLTCKQCLTCRDAHV